MRMRGELDPKLAATEYEVTLDGMAKASGEQVYRHDLLLLGLGDDGHTASLFPDSAALTENTRRVVPNFVEKLSSWRLTFTFPLIAAARRVCFLVDGRKHAELIDRVWSNDGIFPASRVDRAAAAVTWILANA